MKIQIMRGVPRPAKAGRWVTSPQVRVPHTLVWVSILKVLILLLCLLSISLAQDIYVYPNKKLADEGLLEYRRYTLDEAQAFDRGGSFDPYLPLDWGQERRLTEQDNVYRARVVTAGDSLFVAYQRIWGRQAYFIRSLTAGNDWEDYRTLVDNSREFSYIFPEITRNSSNLFIGMVLQELPQGNNLGYFRSTDYGASWGELLRVFPNESDEVGYTSVCNVAQTVYMANSGGSRDTIYVLRSTNWGDTWNARGFSVAYLNTTPQPITVRASGDDVHLVWVNEEGTISCRYSRSTDSGQSWSEEIDIAQDSLGAQRVFIAVQDTHVVACWMGYKYSPYGFTGDLFIRRSFDSGQSWGDEQVLTDLHKVRRGTVYIEDSLIVAVWMDQRFEDGGDEIIARYSYDYGAGWSEETRLSYGEGHSYDPISCRTGDLIHVIWGDIRPEAPGLYYCVNDPQTDIEEDETLPPKSIYLNSYPNPFNARTIITYDHIEGGDIEIFSIAGRLIKTIVPTGKEGRITWDATDDTNRPISSGVYFIRARTSQGYASRKVVYLR